MDFSLIALFAICAVVLLIALLVWVTNVNTDLRIELDKERATSLYNERWAQRLQAKQDKAYDLALIIKRVSKCHSSDLITHINDEAHRLVECLIDVKED